jgi:hypothetical protein
VDLAVAVMGGGPRPGRDLADGVLHVVGDGGPDRVMQAPAGPGQPTQQLGAAAGVAADQRLAQHRLRQLARASFAGSM